MVSSLVRVVYGATVTLLLTLVVTGQALGDDGTINNPTAGTQYLTNSTIVCGGNCTPFNAYVYCRIPKGGINGPGIKEAGEPPPSPSWPKDVKVSNVAFHVQGRPIKQLGVEPIHVKTNDRLAVRVEFSTDKRILWGAVESRTAEGVIAQSALCRIEQPSPTRTVLAADVAPIQRPGTYRLRVLAFSTSVVEQPLVVSEP